MTDQLTECARAAVRTKGTYLAAHYAQLRGRRGEPKAIGAIRHDLLVAYYHVVRDQVPFRALGPDWQRKRSSPEHRARRLQRQLEALGYKVYLEQVEQTKQAATTATTATHLPSAPPADSTVPAQTQPATRGFTGQPHAKAAVRHRLKRVPLRSRH